MPFTTCVEDIFNLKQESEAQQEKLNNIQNRLTNIENLLQQLLNNQNTVLTFLILANLN